MPTPTNPKDAPVEPDFAALARDRGYLPLLLKAGGFACGLTDREQALMELAFAAGRQAAPPPEGGNGRGVATMKAQSARIATLVAEDRRLTRLLLDSDLDLSVMRGRCATLEAALRRRIEHCCQPDGAPDDVWAGYCAMCKADFAALSPASSTEDKSS